MKIAYSLFDPSGNVTALVQTDVNEKYYAAVSKEILKIEPSAQQVGFVKNGNLYMSGGEFCGNASASLACLKLKNSGEDSTNIKAYSFDVSGAGETVKTAVKKISENEFTVSVDMPLFKNIDYIDFKIGTKKLNLPVVKIPGIYHIIIAQNIEKKPAESLIKKWCFELNADALGLMFFDEQKSRLKPLVYVKAVDTLYWESSCASGTSALGFYISKKYESKVSLNISEEGGTLTVDAAPSGKVKLTGNVRFIGNKEFIFNE